MHDLGSIKCVLLLSRLCPLVILDSINKSSVFLICRPQQCTVEEIDPISVMSICTMCDLIMRFLRICHLKSKRIYYQPFPLTTRLGYAHVSPHLANPTIRSSLLLFPCLHLSVCLSSRPSHRDRAGLPSRK